MKHKSVLLIAGVGIAAGILYFLANQGLPIGKDIVKNGGFEDGTAFPNDWWTYTNGFDGDFEFPQSGGFEGKTIKLISNQSSGLGIIGQTIILKGSHRYTLEGMIQTEITEAGIDAGAFLLVDCYASPAENFKYLGGLDSFHIWDSETWKPVSSTQTLPAGTYQINVCCVLKNTLGSASFDNISLKLLD